MPTGIYKRSESEKVRLRNLSKGRKQTLEWKETISKINKGNKYALGRKQSQKERLMRSKIIKKHLPKTIFKKGSIPWNKGKKTNLKPWNYIDGRSKNCSPARYGDDWEAIRYLVYLRDKFTCQECGIKGISLHIHHKVPFLQTFDNSLKNLITLCPSCHRKIDAQLIKEMKMEVKLF